MVASNYSNFRSCLLLCLSLCFIVSGVYAQDDSPTQDFPTPENVRIEDGVLRWNAVPEAGGYNILFNARDVRGFFNLRNMNYLDTVIDATEYNVTQVGTYQVIAFNENASLFSPTINQGDAYYNPDDLNVGQPTSILEMNLMQVRSVTCENVEPGGSCRAVCPLEHDIATGGACSTSDIIEADATATTISYQCTVPLFSGFVTAQVYCLNSAVFVRSQNAASFGFR